MGILFSIPLAGTLGTIAASCLGGLAFCFTSTAGQFVALRRMAALTRVDSLHVLQVVQLQLVYRH
jgi:hypothetical protein